MRCVWAKFRAIPPRVSADLPARAVGSHVYQEESDWFEYLKAFASAEAQAHATARYREEYGRYIDGGPSLGGFAAEQRSVAAGLGDI